MVLRLDFLSHLPFTIRSIHPSSLCFDCSPSIATLRWFVVFALVAPIPTRRQHLQQQSIEYKPGERELRYKGRKDGVKLADLAQVQIFVAQIIWDELVVYI